MIRSKLFLTATVVVGLGACAGGDMDEAPAATDSEAPPAASVTDTDVPRAVYWGDTHLHTGWSADAGFDGAIRDPFDAYRFARGEQVESNSGLPAQLERPLDWLAVTDHSDGMGTVNQVREGNEEMMADPTVRAWRDSIIKGEEAAAAVKNQLIQMQSNGELPEVIMDPKWMNTAWNLTIDAAEQYNEPGEFTALIAYEWTVNSEGGNNLHRNVIFRDGEDRARQAVPFTTFESMDPEDLWAWMANYEETTGGRVLAIPHNGNLSNGRMFELSRFDGSPLTAQYAESRSRWEPLFEVTQIKGQSEVHPSLAPNDEFAAYDLWDRGNLIGIEKPEGAYRTEYWREALKNGLRLEEELGANPFTYGANGATDAHTGLSATDEDNFFGKFKTIEPRADRWNFPVLEGVETEGFLGWEQAAAGIMGVWATSNTREALWDAMMRKETYASTGPRIEVRMFGGFDFTEADLQGDMVQAGYDRGVPMGGTLTGGEGAPTFLVAARRDPTGANLDRLQIVKGWLEADGTTQERVYDVAWSDDREPGADGRLPAVGNTVDLETAEYTNDIGAPELMRVWTDPDFDPSEAAFYYVRVLEIPTPRWTLHDEVRFDVDMPDYVPRTLQERAISSPIWYEPGS